MKLRNDCALFFLGGVGYVSLELVYRGRSHVSMFAAGGLCFLLLGTLEDARRPLPQPLRCLAGAAIITAVELAVGLVCNRSYTVWDYRDRPGNFLGQICPLFTLLWIPVAFGAGQLYRFIRRQLVPGPDEADGGIPQDPGSNGRRLLPHDGPADPYPRNIRQDNG